MCLKVSCSVTSKTLNFRLKVCVQSSWYLFIYRTIQYGFRVTYQNKSSYAFTRRQSQIPSLWLHINIKKTYTTMTYQYTVSPSMTRALGLCHCIVHYRVLHKKASTHQVFSLVVGTLLCAVIYMVAHRTCNAHAYSTWHICIQVGIRRCVSTYESCFQVYITGCLSVFIVLVRNATVTLSMTNILRSSSWFSLV